MRAMPVYREERSDGASKTTMRCGNGTACAGAICSPMTSTNCIASPAQLGLHRSSYQGPLKTGKPHYDLTAFERDRALRLGAVLCSREEIVAVLHRVRPKRMQFRMCA